MTRLFSTILVAVLLHPAFLPAQGDAVSKEEQDLNRKATRILSSFARTAERNKVGPKARQAYNLILDFYDPDNASARKALGYKRSGREWMPAPANRQPQWKDAADDEDRFEVREDWYEVVMELSTLHRELGLEMMESENPTRGTFHLERAVFFNPADRAAHLALGHQEYEGFFGDEDDVAFVKRMKAIETRALELARKDYEVEPVPIDEIPEELKRTNLAFYGARSEHYTIFTRGTQENADKCVKWAERALDFLEFCIGEDAARRWRLRKNQRNVAWIGFVWTEAEWETFVEKNPELWEGRERVGEWLQKFRDLEWRDEDGIKLVNRKLRPALQHDFLVAYLWTKNLPFNAAAKEGAMHAACWYLLSTCMTRFGALAEGTVGSRELSLPDSANWWIREMRDQATAGTDWPLNQVPREQLSNFRNDVRLKTWSFFTWCMARYPEKWLEFLSKLPREKIPFPEEVDAIGEEVFGVPLATVEAEWRTWARGDSGVAAATGYGPPLLPEKPNPYQVRGLQRLNDIRGVAELSACDLDAEATLACEEHARYLTRYPDQHVWPEAHEQDPAREGFTPRGMRAGLRSVIVIYDGEPDDFGEESVDGWIGTVYHRFPLLEHNIDRIGFAAEMDNGYSVCVLDMGSLEEPYDPAKAPKWVPWPADGMKNVPRRFHGREHPNPLGDQAPDQQDITKTGYPISLQFSRGFAAQLVSTRIAVYEVPGGWRIPDKDEADPKPPGYDPDPRRQDDSHQVDCWIHLPHQPLLARMEGKDYVFAIPREPLDARETYWVLVELKTSGGTKKVHWSFTTGSQMEGLGRL